MERSLLKNELTRPTLLEISGYAGQALPDKSPHLPLSPNLSPPTKDCPATRAVGLHCSLYFTDNYQGSTFAVLCHRERRRPCLLRVGLCVVAVASKPSFTPT